MCECREEKQSIPWPPFPIKTESTPVSNVRIVLLLRLSINLNFTTMATITSIQYTEIITDKYANIAFSNGAAMCCRLVRHTDNEDLVVTPSKKLVSISLPDYKCQVLCEGVSIR